MGKMSLIINKIYNENCIDTMKKLSNNFIDLSITSPPYNMNLRIRNGEYCSRQITKELTTKYSNFNDNLPIEEFYYNHKLILGELIRVSKLVFYNIQIVTGSKRAFFKIIGDFANNLKEIIVWDKLTAEPAIQSGVLNRKSELLLIFENEKDAISRSFKNCYFERGTLNDIWHLKRSNKSFNNHKATFSEELVSKIILNFSKKGDLIYDPFMGTGTTARIAKINNRNYIGSEISKEYCELSENRINPQTNQINLINL